MRSRFGEWEWVLDSRLASETTGGRMAWQHMVARSGSSSAGSACGVRRVRIARRRTCYLCVVGEGGDEVVRGSVSPCGRG